MGELSTPSQKNDSESVATQTLVLPALERLFNGRIPTRSSAMVY